MLFRQLMTRVSRPCWTVAVRGKKDLPMWAPFRRADAVWDDPWFRDFFRPMGLRRVDEQLRDAVQQMNRLASMSPWRVFMESPFRAAEHGVNAEIVQAEIDKEGLHLKLNVSHYEPKDLSIKVVGNRLIISGKHEKKSDEHGFVTREFTRELMIPEEVDMDTLASRLTEDGHLVISARVKAVAEPEGRNIAIEHGQSEKDESKNTDDKSKD